MGIIANRGPMTAMRDVSPTLCMQALFGGPFSQIGWLFFGFGLIFFWVFVLQSEAVTWWKFTGQLATAPGIVTGMRDTRAYEGGSDNERGMPIYAIDYTFTPPGSDRPVNGTSYILGAGTASGMQVTVEYRPGHPQTSRIQGMRSAVFDWPIIFVTIFPAVGFALMIGRLLKGWRAINMMKYGLPAMGTLVSVETTGVEVNDRPVYRMNFRFTAANGQQYTAKLKTANPERAWLSLYHPPQLSGVAAKFAERLGVDPVTQTMPPMEIAGDHPAEQQEMILYHPSDPSIAFVPAEFGPQIRVDAQGNIQGDNPAVGFKTAILPALVIIGHGWYILFHLLR